MLEVALRLGNETRIGLEDTPTLPNGQLAKDNAELVALAVRKARQIGALRERIVLLTPDARHLHPSLRFEVALLWADIMSDARLRPR